MEGAYYESIPNKKSHRERQIAISRDGSERLRTVVAGTIHPG
jgi:hypothetical protein